jgi:Ankyrin repeats (3 copies)
LNEVPPSQDDDDEALDLYRRASALDASRPSESVRRSVLELATRLATERASRDVSSKIDVTQPAANQPWRRPAIFGTLAAAALAGLLIAPHFLPPRDTHTAAMSARVARLEAPSSPAAAAPAAAPTSAPAPVAPPASAAQFAEQSRAADSAPPAMVADEPHPARVPAESASLGKMRLTARNSAAAAAAADAARDASADAARVSSAEFAANSARAKAQDTAGEGSTAAAARSDAESKASSEYAEITVTGARRAERLRANDAVVAAPPPVVASAPAPWASQSAGLLAGKTVPDAALRRAAEIGDVPELQALLEKKLAINARDESGRTALMLATLHGQGDAVDVLLSHGADPNIADAHGTTPLQAALAGNQAAIAAALQRAGAR